MIISSFRFQSFGAPPMSKYSHILPMAASKTFRVLAFYQNKSMRTESIQHVLLRRPNNYSRLMARHFAFSGAFRLARRMVGCHAIYFLRPSPWLVIIQRN
jgi:hypothetical protein